LLGGIGGWSKNNFFFTFIYFWVVGFKKALKKSEIGLGLSHYFYYQPVFEQNKSASLSFDTLYQKRE